MKNILKMTITYRIKTQYMKMNLGLFTKIKPTLCNNLV